MDVQVSAVYLGNRRADMYKFRGFGLFWNPRMKQLLTLFDKEKRGQILGDQTWGKDVRQPIIAVSMNVF